MFGLFAKLQRSVFVDRTRRLKTGEVNAEIAARMAEGEPVVLFGEGTSSDGNRVLPFRSALIGAAHEALEQRRRRRGDGCSRCRSPIPGSTACRWAASCGPTSPGTATWTCRRISSACCKRSAIDVVVSFGPVLRFDGSVRPQGDHPPAGGGGAGDDRRRPDRAGRCRTPPPFLFCRKPGKTPDVAHVRGGRPRPGGRDGDGRPGRRFTVPSHPAATLEKIDRFALTMTDDLKPRSGLTASAPAGRGPRSSTSGRSAAR